MNFQQLRIVRETIRRNFNLSEAAAALFTSQSGVSKHIKDLEDELKLVKTAARLYEEIEAISPKGSTRLSEG